MKLIEELIKNSNINYPESILTNDEGLLYLHEHAQKIETFYLIDTSACFMHMRIFLEYCCCFVLNNAPSKWRKRRIYKFSIGNFEKYIIRNPLQLFLL